MSPAAFPIAWLSILFDASMGPNSRSGRFIGQGNLVEAWAMLNTAGETIAKSQRMVFQVTSFFLSSFVIGGCVVADWQLGSAAPERDRLPLTAKSATQSEQNQRLSAPNKAAGM